MRQCKPNNAGNEHDTSGLLQKNYVYINKKKRFNELETNALLQRNVYRNKKIQKPKQQAGNEQVENKKTMTRNRTTVTQTNNVGNEHDRSNKPILFASKYSVRNFSTFDTTCFNRHK